MKQPPPPEPPGTKSGCDRASPLAVPLSSRHYIISWRYRTWLLLILLHLVLILLHLARRRLRRDAAAAARVGLLPAGLPFAGDGAAREDVPGVGPVAERIAVPRRLRRQRGQMQLLPDRARPLHEFARRQRQRRRRVLEGSIDTQRRILRRASGFWG